MNKVKTNPAVENLVNTMITNNQKKEKNKFFTVMFFEEHDNGFDLIGQTPILENAIEAFNIYANTPCPASQMIEAKTIEELEAKIEKMKENFQNETWLKENIYPFI